MKAIKYRRYGGPEVLEYTEDFPKPAPKSGEMLLRVMSTTVQPVDIHTMRGTPTFIRMSTGLFSPKHPIIGCDVAGVVEQVGQDVTDFKVGDEVFGEVASTGYGAFAEYVCSQQIFFAKKPDYLPFDEAACIPVAAGAALQILRKQMHLDKDPQHAEGTPKRLLIIGASGGVGTFAVQIAKQFGAHITGVCSAKNADMVKELGADEIIDYAKEDWAKNGQQYDFILDNIVDHTTDEYANSLAKDGLYVFNSDNMGIAARIAFHPNRGQGRTLALAVSGDPTREELEEMAQMHKDGKLKIMIHKRYPLKDLPEAMALADSGHAPAKLVINPQAEGKDEGEEES